VQAVLVPIDVLALFGVVLDHHIFLLPEDILDETHLTPVRSTVWKRHRHMLPADTITGNHTKVEGLMGDQKCAVVPPERQLHSIHRVVHNTYWVF